MTYFDHFSSNLLLLAKVSDNEVIDYCRVIDYSKVINYKKGILKYLSENWRQNGLFGTKFGGKGIILSNLCITNLNLPSNCMRISEMYLQIMSNLLL